MNRPAKIAVALGLCLAFGAVRLPVERRLDADRRAAGLRDDAGLPQPMGEEVSQAALVAVLGGLRSLVAALTDLKAYDAWEKTRYADVEKAYRFCQRLQPRQFYYWDRGQWMMATNAVRYYRMTSTGRGALNSLLRSAYVEKGLQMVKEGQRFLPDDPRMFDLEALLYKDRIRPRQPAQEAEAWRRASECPDSDPKMQRLRARMQAYALAHVPGAEAEAEAALLKLYEADRSNRVPTVATLLNIFSLVRQTENWLAEPDLYRALREIYDRSPVTRIPLLIATLRRLEDRLGIPLWRGIPLVEAGDEDWEDS